MTNIEIRDISTTDRIGVTDEKFTKNRLMQERAIAMMSNPDLPPLVRDQAKHDAIYYSMENVRSVNGPHLGKTAMNSGVEIIGR